MWSISAVILTNYAGQPCATRIAIYLQSDCIVLNHPSPARALGVSQPLSAGDFVGAMKMPTKTVLSGVVRMAVIGRI